MSYSSVTLTDIERNPSQENQPAGEMPFVKRGIHRVLQSLHPFSGDRLFLSMLHRLFTGKWPDLKNPKGFTEKMQWLKLNFRLPEMTAMTDKIQAKDVAASAIGYDHIIPLLGKWDSVKEIDFDSLPERFVLKTNNGGGGNAVVIVADKNRLDREECRRKLQRMMRNDIYARYGEWQYSGIKPMLFAESLLMDEDGLPPEDYKFFCFNGNVRFMKVDSGRFGEHRATYFSPSGKPLDIRESQYLAADSHPELPENLPEMVRLSERLSAGFPFIRIDLYCVGGKIYFGEYTFYPGSGLYPFLPAEAESAIGKMIELPLHTRD